jgi:hypothetical protein
MNFALMTGSYMFGALFDAETLSYNRAAGEATPGLLCTDTTNNCKQPTTANN